MAEHILAVIIALLTGLTVGLGEIGQRLPSTRDGGPPDLQARREAIERTVDDLLDRARSRIAEAMQDAASRQPSEPPEAPASQDGCHTTLSAGDGWKSTTVVCSEQSHNEPGASRSNIAISSSRITVSSTSSVDEP